MDDNDQYAQFLEQHKDELVAKAEAAVGTVCPACTPPEPGLLELVEPGGPWLRCTRTGHTIRCWTDTEIEAMG